MLDDLKEKWPEILDFFKQEYDIADVSFKTWILPLEVESFENNMITLVFPGESGKTGLQYINKKYLALLKISIEETLNQELELQIILPNETVSKIEDESSKISSVSQEDISLENRILDANLNKKYTFDSFVVGSNNNIAQVTSLAVAESPGDVYNPLFIYGGVGLGKTHLMQAVGNRILQNNRSMNIVYVTSEKFTNHLINSIREGKNDPFRNKYRSADALLIDDIQFIAKKERVQEEFFHTFNTLYENGKQIIISSDKPPRDLPFLEERLKSRFEWGLLADISCPDYETRVAILRKKALDESIIIDDEILADIATKIDSNIRELEGVFNKIVARASLTHSPITIELAENVINEFISKKEKVISSDYIQETVAKYFSIDKKELAGEKRSNDIAFPRQIAMYLCREVANMSFPQIGIDFGKRDHSTVMHAYKKIAKEIKEKTNTKLIVESVKNIILNVEN